MPKGVPNAKKTNLAKQHALQLLEAGGWRAPVSELLPLGERYGVKNWNRILGGMVKRQGNMYVARGVRPSEPAPVPEEEQEERKPVEIAGDLEVQVKGSGISATMKARKVLIFLAVVMLAVLPFMAR